MDRIHCFYIYCRKRLGGHSFNSYGGARFCSAACYLRHKALAEK